MKKRKVRLADDPPDPVNPIFIAGDANRLINIAFDFTFKEARLGTTGVSDLEHNKYVGEVSTITSVLTGKDGDLNFYFVKIIETEAGIGYSSLKQEFINNHEVHANKETVTGHFTLE